MNETLRILVKDFRDARDFFCGEVAAIQARCPHERVWEVPQESLSTLGGFLERRRMCDACRLEMEAGVDRTAGPLGDKEGRWVMPASRDAFYRLRIPE